MEPPSVSLREQVARSIAGISAAPDESIEQDLEGLLIDIEIEMRQAPDHLTAAVAPEAAEDELATINAWAGLISCAVARTYAPASPWPRQLGGWSAKIMRKLQSLIGLLRPKLQAIAAALNAVHCSISVSFPWGISIGMSF